MFPKKTLIASYRNHSTIEERKQLQIRENAKKVLKNIHFKVMEHMKTKDLLDQRQINNYLKAINKLVSNQSDIEAFRKKIKNMLLTISDSIMQFEHAMNGEDTLHSIEITQNCNYLREMMCEDSFKLSHTSFGIVPCLSSLELTNENFLTLSAESCTNTNISDGKKDEGTNCRNFSEKIIDNSKTKLCNLSSPIKEKNNDTSEVRKKVANTEKIRRLQGESIYNNVLENFTIPKKKYILETEKKLSSQKDICKNVEKSHMNIVMPRTEKRRNKAGSQKLLKDYHDVRCESVDSDETFVSRLDGLCINSIDTSETSPISDPERLDPLSVQPKGLRHTQKSKLQRKSNTIPCSSYKSINMSEDILQQSPVKSSHSTTEKTITYLNASNSVMHKNKNDRSIDNYVIPETQYDHCSYKKNEHTRGNLEDTQMESSKFVEEIVDQKTNSKNKNLAKLNHITSNNMKESSQPRQNSNAQVSNITGKSLYSKNVAVPFGVPDDQKNKRTSKSSCDNENVKINTKSEIFPFKDSFLSTSCVSEKKHSSDPLKFTESNVVENTCILPSPNLMVMDGRIVDHENQARIENSKSPIFRKLEKSRLVALNEEMDLSFQFKPDSIEKLTLDLEIARKESTEFWKTLTDMLEETKNEVANCKTDFPNKFNNESLQFPKGYEHHYPAVKKVVREYEMKFGLKKLNGEEETEPLFDFKMDKWSELQNIIFDIQNKRKEKIKKND